MLGRGFRGRPRTGGHVTGGRFVDSLAVDGIVLIFWRSVVLGFGFNTHEMPGSSLLSGMYGHPRGCLETMYVFSN